MLNLKSILYAITPENIKSIPLVNISLGIFVDYIMSSNELSQRVSAIFDVDSMPDESETQKRTKEVLRKGVYCTWIYTLYSALEKLTINSDVVQAIEKNGYDNASLLKGLDKILTPEIINTNRAFSQKVGTPSAMRYMYYFGRYLETGSYDLDLEITEDRPFVIHYKGSMTPAMFYGIVKPMAHPIGWVESYEHILTLAFQEYFGIDISIIYDRIEFNSLDKWVIFIADDNIARIYEEFTTTRINPTTGKYYKKEEVDALVEIFTHKAAENLEQTINDDGTTNRVITFKDGTILTQQGKEPSFIRYQDREWGDSWVFYGSTVTNFKFLYEDNIDEWLIEIDFAGMNNTGKANQETTYIGLKPDNCFKIGGDEYPFMVGCDESRYRVTNRKEISQILAENFDTKFEYKVYRSSYITISDDFNHKLEFYIDFPNTDRWKFGEISLNTLSLHGFNYRVDIKEIGGYTYWYRKSGLNQHDPLIELTEIKPQQSSIHISGMSRLGQNDWGEDLILRLTLIDSKGNKISQEILEDGTWETEMPTAHMAPGKFRLDLDAVNTYGRSRINAFYEGSDIWAYSDIEPYVTFLKYETRHEMPSVESEPISHVFQADGTYSTAEYVKTRIGQFYKGGFDEADSAVQEWINPDNPILPWDIPELDEKIIRGSYIEGNSYRDSFSDSEKYQDEETFIAKGFGHFPIENPDFVVMDAQKYATDSFDIDVISAHGGYYLVTDVDENDYRGRYLFTTDMCYLYTKEWYVKLSLEARNDQKFRVYVVDKRLRWRQIKKDLPIPEKTGYSFKYWSLANQGAEIPDEHAFENDTTLYAVYLELPSTIAIRFNSQGGSEIPQKVLPSGMLWNDVRLMISPPTRNGYDFKYWSLSAGGVPCDLYYRFTANVTLYAVWELHHYEYLISFRENGGSSIPDIRVRDDIPFSEWKILVFPPYRYGYNFKYWSLTEGGVEVSPEWRALSDTTMYAVWETNQMLNLTFDSMGGSYVKKLSVNPLERQSLPVPKRDGFTFKHWSTSPHGSAVDLKTLNGLTNKKLYAVWS